MLTQAWYPLRYHPQQARLWRTKARFCALACGRGSGKTELSRRRIVRFLPVKKPWSNPLYLYALPTHAQAKRVAWDEILKLIPREWIKGQPNKSDMCIETVFGSKLYVMGMDKPQRAEGVQWDGAVIDESCDQRPGLFDKTLLPAFSHRHAWCWRIGVPKRFGIGANEFKEFWDKGNKNEDGIESYCWSSEDILTPEQIAFAKAHLDAKDYAEQYQASWESASGAIFYAFSDANITHEVVYDPSATLVVGSDFNVNPMCWVLGHIVDDEVHIFDEIFIRNTNTEATLDHLAHKYADGHKGGWLFMGDASASARKTSASASDYAQIRGDGRFTGARISYPRKNPRIVNRFASCNALIKAADGTRRLFIHPRCKHLIADLKARAWKEDIREPDDYGDIGHITDALGYIIHGKFPSTMIRADDAPEVHI